MSNHNILKFFGKSKEGKVLSNFHKEKVVIDGREYNCGEGAFHGCKYIVLSNMEDGTMVVVGDGSCNYAAIGKSIPLLTAIWNSLRLLRPTFSPIPRKKHASLE